VMGAAYFGRAGWGLAMLVLFFVEWLAPAWFEVYWNGQTPGKRALGIAVLNDDGTPVRWGPALTRNLLRAVDFLPFLYGFGLAAMLANRDFKRLGDLAAGTVVVYAPKRSRARALPQARAEPPPFALTLEEQRVVLDLAERSASLTHERLEELAMLPAPLIGRATGAAAAARLLGMASHLAGRQ
jgi:RDD family